MENKANDTVPEKSEKEEKAFSVKVGEFITKHRKIFLAVAGFVAAVLLFVGIYSIVSSSMAKSSSRAMEEARTKLVSWSAESDQAKKDELEQGILADLDAIAKKWPRSFAAQQALFTKANIAAAGKKWEDAEKFAADAANRMPKSYLAPIALENAAVAAEEGGNAEKAFEYYAKIAKDYQADNPVLAHAYFSLGRLSEGKSDWKSALEYYGKVSGNFADSDWASLAKDRVVYLKSQGLDQ